MPLQRQHAEELALTQRARVGVRFGQAVQAVPAHVSDVRRLVRKLRPTL